MPYMIKFNSIDKQKNFVYIWILKQIGKNVDGSNFGLDKILTQLAIASQENKKIKEIVLGI